MLFFLNLDGTVTRNDAERIYMGTNDAVKVQLITPITPLNTTIEVAFTYPDGLVTTYYPLEVLGKFVLGDFVRNYNEEPEQEISVDAPPYINVYLWQLILPENITAQSGTVVVTFRITKPVNIVSAEELPESGETGTYYYVDGTYYEWVNDAGVFAESGALVGVEGSNNSVSKYIGVLAEEQRTNSYGDSVRKVLNAKVVGNADITYSQQSQTSIITLDFLPNESTIVAHYYEDNVGFISHNCTYNELNNTITISDVGDSYSVEYRLSSDPQIVSLVYVYTSQCEERQGHFIESDDTIEAFDNTHARVTTSPCAFTVEYAVLESPPSGATTDDITQLLILLNSYYDNLVGRVSDIESDIRDGTIIGLGDPTATAHSLQPGADPTVSAQIDPNSPQQAKVIEFDFGIPKGDKGDDGAVALSYSTTMSVTNATMPTINTETEFSNGWFNRTPQENDTFYVVAHNTQTGQNSMIYYRVYEVGETTTTAVCFFISYTSSTRTYKGVIEESDWSHVGNRYFYTVANNEHNIMNPIVLELLVPDTLGYGNAFYSYQVMPNGSIQFTSDLAVNAKYTIFGE